MTSHKRSITATVESWALLAPFTITGYTFTAVELVHVSVSENDHVGNGEAAGVYYLDETGDCMLAQIESVRAAVENGATRDELLKLLPAGGARNAIDCALWDLEAKLGQTTIWSLTGINPGPTETVNTVVIDTPDAMAKNAMQLNTRKLKVKLSGDEPLARIRAVREARPDADIVVDVNQGWTFDQLVELAPSFAELGIAMIEQPLPRGGDDALEDYHSPVVLCADESCLDTSEFAIAARRYQMINIKLDKTGGLTEALALAALARQSDVQLMVGNMIGTSLAMAPGYVIAQYCQFVDLDGAMFLTRDRDNPMHCDAGFLAAPLAELWG